MNVVTRIVAALVAAVVLALAAAPAHAVFADPEPHPTREGWTCLQDEHLAFINDAYNDAQRAADAYRQRASVLTQNLATSGMLYRQLEAENVAQRQQIAERDATIVRQRATIERLRDKLRNR